MLESQRLNYRNLLSDFFFPSFCVGCCRPGVFLCYSCLQKIHSPKSQTCLYCQGNSYLGITHKNCFKSHCLSGVFSLFNYSGVAAKVLKYAKFKTNKQVLKEGLWASVEPGIWSTMNDYLKVFRFDVITFIPLYKADLSQRSFNQSQELAMSIGSLLNIPVVNFLEKTRTTPKQSSLNFKDRRLNLLNAFSLIKINKKELVRKRILVVDDVVTTGATMSEAGKTLLDGGAREIFGLSLLRA